MVEWTTPFMIGITNGSLNSDDVLFQPLPGIYIIIPQSTFARSEVIETSPLVLETNWLP